MTFGLNYGIFSISALSTILKEKRKINFFVYYFNKPVLTKPLVLNNVPKCGPDNDKYV